MPRLPALDGLRAVALGAVLLFHADYVWAKGGHLGVTAFFTLSGFLITALLLLERDATGRIDLVAFWGRRARRLVPAALVCLALVVVYVAASPEVTFDGLVGDAAASVTWLANWRFVAEGEAYADLFSTPSPFQHFWSLAIEEQFYLALPLVAAVLLGLRGRRTRRLPLAVVGVGVIAASTAAAAFLHEPGEPALRAYYGTDARIAEPLVGVVLALILIGPVGLRRFQLWGRRLADTAGVLALGGLAVLASTLSPWDIRLYEGGFLLTSVLAAFVVMAATQRGGVVDRMLSAPILAGIGRISYGAYLFHWPVYLWITEHRTGLEGGQLLGLRVGVTLTLAAVSYLFIELPIRERRLPVQVGALAWPTATVGLMAALVAAMAIPVAGGSSGALSSGSSGSASAGAAPTQPDRRAGGAPASAEAAGASQAVATGSAPVAAATPNAERSIAPGPDGPTPTSAPPAEPPQADVAPAVRVAIVGDSLSANLSRGFEIWGEQTGEVAVGNFALGGCPVSRDGTRRFPNGHEWGVRPLCSWWSEDDNEVRMEAEMRAELIGFDPDVVVVQDSINVLPDRKLDDWPTYMRPGQPVFDTWLISEYEALIDTMRDLDAEVVLTNAVCADFDRRRHWNSLDDADSRVRTLNRRVYALLGERAELADLNARLCPGGEYSDTVEGYENARPDGFHLTDQSAAALVENWLGPLVVSAANRAA